jgi:hypothetical protein
MDLNCCSCEALRDLLLFAFRGRVTSVGNDPYCGAAACRYVNLSRGMHVQVACARVAHVLVMSDRRCFDERSTLQLTETIQTSTHLAMQSVGVPKCPHVFHSLHNCCLHRVSSRLCPKLANVYFWALPACALQGVAHNKSRWRRISIGVNFAVVLYRPPRVNVFSRIINVTQLAIVYIW